MREIEKNNVDISKLFDWGKSFKIFDNSHQELATVHIRIIGDEDINKARVYALRKSSELRKKLKTNGTDEREAFIPDLDGVEKENLIESILTLHIKRITSDIVRTLDLETLLPPEPKEDATLEEQEEYQEIVDNWPTLRREKIEDAVRSGVDKERERLQDYSLESLKLLYEKYITDELCSTEMYKAFKEMSTYFGVYSDEKFKNRLFKSFGEFSNLPSFIKNQIMSYYQSLEIDSDELKKLPGATQ